MRDAGCVERVAWRLAPGAWRQGGMANWQMADRRLLTTDY